jgi:hypothetical protein
MSLKNAFACAEARLSPVIALVILVFISPRSQKIFTIVLLDASIYHKTAIPHPHTFYMPESSKYLMRNDFLISF